MDDPSRWDGLWPIPELAARRRRLFDLIDARARLDPASDGFALSCREYHRVLDSYTRALTEAAPPSFIRLSQFLTSIPEVHPDRPWYILAVTDWFIGPTEARRRLVTLDQEVNHQLLGVAVRGDSIAADHESDHHRDDPPGAV